MLRITVNKVKKKNCVYLKGVLSGCWVEESGCTRTASGGGGEGSSSTTETEEEGEQRRIGGLYGYLIEVTEA